MTSLNEPVLSWTAADFPQMSWHDNHFHGLAIRSGEHCTDELERKGRE
jgi:hypothetical protein